MNAVARSRTLESCPPSEVRWPRSAALKAALESLGHEVRVRRLNSGLHVIRRNADGGLEAGVDTRREGLALGG